jgi:hypothetical protein
VGIRLPLVEWPLQHCCVRRQEHRQPGRLRAVRRQVGPRTCSAGSAGAGAGTADGGPHVGWRHERANRRPMAARQRLVVRRRLAALPRPVVLSRVAARQRGGHGRLGETPQGRASQRHHLRRDHQHRMASRRPGDQCRAVVVAVRPRSRSPPRRGSRPVTARRVPVGLRHQARGSMVRSATWRPAIGRPMCSGSPPGGRRPGPRRLEGGAR